MTTRERFIILLFGRNKRPLYLDDNGFITEGNDSWLKTNNELAKIEFSPGGWKDALIKYARNVFYLGITRDMTTPITFYKDGYKILKYITWLPNGGVETSAHIGILKLDELELPYNYKKWYFGELNFSKFEHGNQYFKIEALEGGMSKVFKAIEKVKFEIPIDEDPQHINVLFDGITLHGKQTMLWADQLMDPYLGADYFTFNFLLAKEQAEGSAPGIIIQESLYQAFFDPDVTSSTNYFLNEDGTNDSVTSVRIHGTLNIKLITQRDNTYFRAEFYKSNFINPFPITKYSITSGPVSAHPLYNPTTKILSVPYDFTIPIFPNDKIYSYGEIGAGTGTGRPSAFQVLETSTMNIEYQGKGNPSYVKGLYASRVLEQIGIKAVGNRDILSPDNVFTKSDWLAGKKDLFITSSDALRGIPNSKIQTSLYEIYKSLQHFGVGLEIKNQKIRIEPHDYFFTNELILDLGEIKDAKLVPANDLIINTIKVGGPEIDYQDVNGKAEPNQTQEWVTPNTREVAELDLTTPWRRDPYGMEFLRNMKGKDTTDAEGDKDVFMVNIEQTSNVDENGIVYYKLNRPAYSLIEGIPDPIGIFNLEYSPKRTLINNMNYILSVMDRREGEFIELANANKNKDLKTILSGVTVDEDLKIQIGSMGVKKFQPYYINFITKVPVILPPIIDEKPYGLLRFTLLNREHFVRWFDGSIKPGDNDQQNYKTLVDASTDLSKFYEPL